MQQSCSAWRTWDLAGVREPFIRFSGFFMDTKCWAGVLYKIQKTKKDLSQEENGIAEDILYLKFSTLCAPGKNELHEGTHTTWSYPVQRSSHESCDLLPWGAWSQEDLNHCSRVGRRSHESLVGIRNKIILLPHIWTDMALDWFAHLKKF